MAPADRLAFSLARAALATPPTSAAESEHTALEHVLRVHADLEAQTRDASGEAAVSRAGLNPRREFSLMTEVRAQAIA